MRHAEGEQVRVLGHETVEQCALATAAGPAEGDRSQVVVKFAG